MTVDCRMRTVDQALLLMTSNGLLWNAVLGSATMTRLLQTLGWPPMPLLRSQAGRPAVDLTPRETGWLVGQTKCPSYDVTSGGSA
jgi:hypothetical protein